jgi:hypothetical protein
LSIIDLGEPLVLACRRPLHADVPRTPLPTPTTPTRIPSGRIAHTHPLPRSCVFGASVEFCLFRSLTYFRTERHPRMSGPDLLRLGW